MIYKKADPANNATTQTRLQGLLSEGLGIKDAARVLEGESVGLNAHEPELKDEINLLIQAVHRAVEENHWTAAIPYPNAVDLHRGDKSADNRIGLE